MSECAKCKAMRERLAAIARRLAEMVANGKCG